MHANGGAKMIAVYVMMACLHLQGFYQTQQRSYCTSFQGLRYVQNAIDRPASEKKKELSPELAERIRKMRGACNTKARGDNRKAGANKKPFAQGSGSPASRSQQPYPSASSGEGFLPTANPAADMGLPQDFASIHRIDSDNGTMHQ